VKIFFRTLLSLILCAVSLFFISALAPGQQDIPGAFSGTGQLHVAEHDTYGPDDLSLRTAAEDYHKPKAARIYQRYHEQLLAYRNTVAEISSPSERLPAKERPLINAEFNSTCLSSCYDYIFRLCPF